jgi:hypothetical protein
MCHSDNAVGTGCPKPDMIEIELVGCPCVTAIMRLAPVALSLT